MIIIQPKGGLCNYLRVIFSYYVFAKKNNKKLLVLWEKTKFTTGFFSEYFLPVDDIIFEYFDNKNQISEVKYKIDYKGSWDHNLGYLPDYQYLKLKPCMISIIKNKQKILANNYIAVHIRRTDLVYIVQKKKKYLDDDYFMNFIDEEKDDKNLYIATDNKETYDTFQNKYKNIVKFKYHNHMGNNKLRATSLKDAVIDLYMCVYADKFIGTNYSSFSYLINILRQNKIPL